jgi:hypothetical protein
MRVNIHFYQQAPSTLGQNKADLQIPQIPFVPILFQELTPYNAELVPLDITWLLSCWFILFKQVRGFVDISFIV